MLYIQQKAANPKKHGFAAIIASQKGLEPPTFRLGVDPKPMYRVIASAKKSLEIQAFSLFSMPSRTAL